MSYSDAIAEYSHHETIVNFSAALRNAGLFVRQEQRLPNRKVADIVSWDRTGDTCIYEVKTVFRHQYLTSAWAKYAAYCNRLYLIVPSVNQNDVALTPWPCTWHSDDDKVGVITFSPHHQDITRNAVHRHTDPTNMAQLIHLLSID